MEQLHFDERIQLPWNWLHLPAHELPYLSLPFFLSTAGSYLLLTALGCYLMKGKSFQVRWLSTPWNIFMTLFSAYACYGTTAVLLRNWASNNYDPLLLVCDPDLLLYKGMQYWFYIFYLSKYWEYFDTFLLVLKGKSVLPPENLTMSLHVYHHAITATVGMVTIIRPFSVAYLGPITNGFVHVIMYFYYFLAENNWVNRSWGGIVVTPLQLLQFLICCFMGIYPSWYSEACQTHWIPRNWLWFIYLSFLGLFWLIFNEKKEQRSRKPKND